MIVLLTCLAISFCTRSAIPIVFLKSKSLSKETCKELDQKIKESFGIEDDSNKPLDQQLRGLKTAKSNDSVKFLDDNIDTFLMRLYWIGEE